MRTLIFVPVLLMLAGCAKQSQKVNADDYTIAIYRLTSHQYLQGQCKIDPAAAVLDTNPFITEQGIVSYDSTACIYLLSDEAAQKMKNLPEAAALAVTINKEVVYYFLNIPMYTNHSCSESVVTAMGLGNGMPIRLGYPSYSYPVAMLDPRNDMRLMLALKAKGKL